MEARAMSPTSRVEAPSLVRSRIGIAAGLCAAAFSVIAARLVEVMVFGAGLDGSVKSGSAGIIAGRRAHGLRAGHGTIGQEWSVA